MQRIQIGLVGLGTIGGGLLALLNENAKLIARRTGIEFQITRVADKDTAKFSKLKNIKASADYKDIINDPDIQIVVELTGGVDFPWKLFQETVESGKHFVTANKALLSKKLLSMFELSRKNQAYIGFEASVGGGIPIIKTLRYSLVGNQILSIDGIINGTTNYILTQMTDKNLPFSEALKKAQELGFAEADPTLDINGDDAASKIAILASLSFNQNISRDDVYLEGIENIELIDIQNAGELDYTVKLVATCKIHEGDLVELRVHPTFVSNDNPLSQVENEYNAILVDTDFLGESMYYGKGAGARPTASAVISDIVELGGKICSKKGYNEHFFSLENSKKIKPISDIPSKFYVRIMTKDEPGILAKVTKVFGDNHISIASVIQKDTGKEFIPLVFCTHEAKEKDFQNSFQQIKSFNFVEKIVYYRTAD